MGKVKGFMVLLTGLIGILIAYGTCAPILDFLIQYNLLLGGNAASVARRVEVVTYIIVPTMLIAVYLLYAFLSATSEEDNSRW